MAQTGTVPNPPIAAPTAAPSAPTDRLAPSGCAQPADETATGLDADSEAIPAAAPPDPPDPAAAPGDTEEEDVPPIAHCSQNAGDEQYQDPFGNSGPPKAGGGGGGKDPQRATRLSGGQDAASPASVLAQQSADPATADAAAAAGDDVAKLPNTGLDARLPGLLGLALLLSGGALRRRHA